MCGIVSYLNTWYLERKNFAPPVDKVNVQFNLDQAIKSQRGIRRITLSLTTTLDGIGWSRTHTGRFTPKNVPLPNV
jgi:hypothetical protein